MRAAHVALCVLVMALWGFNFVPMKVSVTAIPPMFVVAVRFSVVALLLLPFVRLPRARLASVLPVAFTLGVLHFALAFTALRYIDAGTAAMVVQLEVPLMVLLGAVLLKERFGWRTALGMVVAFAGAALIGGEPRILDQPLGFALILAAALVWAYANIQVKRLEGIPPLTLTALLSGFAAPALFALSFLFEEGQVASLAGADWRAHAALLYMIFFASILSYGLWFYLLRHHPVHRVALFMPLVPVFAVIASVLVLGERLGRLEALGGALTVLGVTIVVLRRARRFEAATPPGE